MRIFYVIDGAFRAGGHRVNLDHVLTLRRLGYDARFWIMRPPEEPAGVYQPDFPPGQEAPWQFDVPDLGARDVLVVGEMFGFAAARLNGAPARKLIHNQGPYYTFKSFLDFGVYRTWGAEAMICPSGYAADLLRRFGWDGPVHVVRPFLDPVFAPDPSETRQLRIAAVTSKRLDEIRLIRGVLRSRRPDLSHVPWTSIRDLPRPEVARLMRGSEIFLAAGLREGLGLPPLEALWTGALVAGFHGGGGREYATPENGDWFDDDQHVEIAEALIRLIDGVIAGEPYEARRLAGLRTAASFSRETFEAQLAQAWTALAGPAA